jgi:hypothetical protein
MAEVLLEHELAIDYAEYFACTCGTIQDTVNGTHSGHVASALSAAGFGPVKDAKADAWDEGVQAGHDGMIGKFHKNPYRARAAAVRGEG